MQQSSAPPPPSRGFFLSTGVGEADRDGCDGGDSDVDVSPGLFPSSSTTGGVVSGDGLGTDCDFARMPPDCSDDSSAMSTSGATSGVPVEGRVSIRHRRPATAANGRGGTGMGGLEDGEVSLQRMRRRRPRGAVRAAAAPVEAAVVVCLVGIAPSMKADVTPARTPPVAPVGGIGGGGNGGGRGGGESPLREQAVG